MTAQAQTTKQFQVTLMRPVFQVARLLVDAADEQDAMSVALEQAARLTESDWSGGFDRALYTYDVKELVDIEPDDDETSANNAEPSSDDDSYRYVLLKGDVDSGEGELIMQPWLEAARKDSLLTLDITSDWRSQIQSIEDDARAQYQELIRSERHDSTGDV